jgi:hypothetical protein
LGPYKLNYPSLFTWKPYGDYFGELGNMWITTLWVLYRRKKNVKVDEKL